MQKREGKRTSQRRSWVKVESGRRDEWTVHDGPDNGELLA